MMRLMIFLFIGLVSQALGQNVLSTRSKKAIELYTQADNYRVRGQFTAAISLLNEALAKDKGFVEAWYRLGLVYMSMKDYERANQYMEKGLSLTMDPRKQKVFWFDLGESYFALGAYDKAGEYISLFLEAEKSHRQKIEHATRLMRNIEFARSGDQHSGYSIRKLSDTVNNFVLQYFPVLTADQQELIFTRRLGGGASEDEDLVISRKNSKGRWTSPESISENINSSLNEGTCTISADGRKLIFTSCAGRDGYGSCDLFESRRVGDRWSAPRNLGIGVNSAEWESQPSLSADGRTLYFVSDRRGGFGRRDLWVSTLNDQGIWTRAKNVGRSVNTPYDEISPFIHANNRTLYFASNGLTGFGGYDIFYSERDTGNVWTGPQNIGRPVNTHEDQFSLFITADGEKGYYSHEEPRDGGYSVSYIYEIRIPESQQIRFKSNYVKGRVRDKTTREPLLAQIELFNLEDNQAESLVESDSVSGDYLMVLTQGAEYALYVSREGYLFQSLHFNYSEVRDFEPIVLDIDLEKVREGTTAVLENIFFDVDKYDLKEKSLTELRKIMRFLRDNPGVKVEIGGHTDNSGSSAYNVELSGKRAAAVYNYLVALGADSNRLAIRGYGSTRPIADNTTEAGRQKNRRIEFRITQ